MSSLAKFQRRHRGRFAAHWMVREGDKMVGPVSLELLERGIRAGKVPLSAEMALEGHDEWLPISQVLPNVKPEVDAAAAVKPNPLITPAPPSVSVAAASNRPATGGAVDESHVRAVPKTKRNWPEASASDAKASQPKASQPEAKTSSPQAQASQPEGQASQPEGEAFESGSTLPVQPSEPEAAAGPGQAFQSGSTLPSQPEASPAAACQSGAFESGATLPVEPELETSGTFQSGTTLPSSEPVTKPEPRASEAEVAPETAPITKPITEPQPEAAASEPVATPEPQPAPQIVERPPAMTTLVSEADAEDDWMRQTVPKDWRRATAPCAPPSEIEAAIIEAEAQPQPAAQAPAAPGKVEQQASADLGPSTDRMAAPETDPAPEVAEEVEEVEEPAAPEDRRSADDEAAEAQRRAWKATTQRPKVATPEAEKPWSPPEHTPFHMQAWEQTPSGQNNPSQPPPAPQGSVAPQAPPAHGSMAPQGAPHGSYPPPAPQGSYPPPAPQGSQPPPARGSQPHQANVSQPPPARAAEDLSPIPGPLPVPQRPDPVSQRFKDEEPVEIPKRGILDAIFR